MAVPGFAWIAENSLIFNESQVTVRARRATLPMTWGTDRRLNSRRETMSVMHGSEVEWSFAPCRREVVDRSWKIG